jgi:DNA-binding NtrC family response regulator
VENQMKKQVNILIVDDIESVIEMLELHITHIIKNNFPDITLNFHKYNSVKSFVEEGSTKYNLAIVDWNIGPSENEKGIRVIERIYLETKNMCIYTGMVDDMGGIVKEATKKGVKTILKKSNDMKKLRDFLFKSFEKICNEDFKVSKSNKSNSKIFS